MQHMADDELDLDKLDTEIEKENKVEKRIKDLSDKVKLTSNERDELKRLGDQKDSENATLKKENEFLNSFGDVLGKHPEASSYRDRIKEKVLKGYSIEDATVSTLASEGKLNVPRKEVIIENPAGGSAVTQPPSGEKPLSQLTRDEKRVRLMEAEARGDIAMN
mgnify:CR=1 FL=1